MPKKIDYYAFEEKIKEKFQDNVDLSLIDKESFNYSKKQKFICKIHNKEFIKYPKVLLKSKYICNECQKESQKLHFDTLHKKEREHYTKEEVKIKLYQKFHGNIYINDNDFNLIKIHDNYFVNCSKKVKVNCSKHGEFYSTVRNLLRSKHGCIKCAKEFNIEQNILNGINRRSTLINQFKQVHGNQYDYSLVNFNTKLQKIKIICNKHGIFEMYPSMHLRGEGCKYCNQDKLNCERRLGELLKQKYPDIQIEQQYHSFLGRQSLDYYLPQCKLGIEYQGSQHFEENPYYEDERHNLEKRKLLDLQKYNKCKEHDIEIIYFTFSKQYEQENYIGKLFVNLEDLFKYIDSIIPN